MSWRGAIAACVAFGAAVLAVVPWICRTEGDEMPSPPREIRLAERTIFPKKGSFPGKFAERQSPSARGTIPCVVVASLFWLCYVMHVNLNGVFGTHLELFDKVAANARWSIVCGWSDSANHVYGGFVRLAQPLFLGLLLSRLGWRIQLKKDAFAIAVGSRSSRLSSTCLLPIGWEARGIIGSMRFLSSWLWRSYSRCSSSWA